MNLLNKIVNSKNKELINLRRKFHKHPERGWLELYTTVEIIKYLDNLAYDLKYGKQILKESSRQGLPTDLEFKKARERAYKWGADSTLLDEIKDGFTGAVAIINSNKPGPTTALRFDIDAIGAQEDCSDEHRPNRENFNSINPNAVHSCGHDGHIAIGLGLAKCVKKLFLQNRLRGKVIFIFQPAEEGVRGARAMADTDLLEAVDYFLSGHIGFKSDTTGQIICGITNSLYTKKFDISIKGKSSHAGAAPQEGQNALLAAVNAVSALYSLTQHGSGMSRLNVGKLKAGTYRNLVPENAEIEMEIRGENDEVISYLFKKVKDVFNGIEDMFNVSVKIKIVGEATAVKSDQKLIDIVKKSAKNVKDIKHIIKEDSLGGSEDVSLLMEKVQTQGGQACYLMFGSDLKAGHHSSNFDFDEKVLSTAVQLYLESLKNLGNIDL